MKQPSHVRRTSPAPDQHWIHMRVSHGRQKQPACRVSVHGFAPSLPDADIEPMVRRTFRALFKDDPLIRVEYDGGDLHWLRVQNVFARLYKRDKGEVLAEKVSEQDKEQLGHGELCKRFCDLDKEEQVSRLTRWLDSHEMKRREDQKYLIKMLRAPGGSKYAIATFRKNEDCQRAVRYSAEHGGIPVARSGRPWSPRGIPGLSGNQDKLRVYLHETIESLRAGPAPELRSAFDVRDLLDKHTLGKILIFLWTYREELLPETAGDEFHLVTWGNAWRSVLARKLRAEKEEDWISAFREAFPYNDPDRLRSDPHHSCSGTEEPEPCSAYLMQLPGKKEPPHRWLGEPDGDPSSSCSRLEQIMLTEAEKLFAEAGRLLDTSGDRCISRTELSTFFSTRTSGNSEEQQYVTRFPEKVAHVPYNGEEDKVQRDQTEDGRKLSARMQGIQQQFAEDQGRTCALHLFKRQYESLLHELCRQEELTGFPRFSLLKSKAEIRRIRRRQGRRQGYRQTLGSCDPVDFDLGKAGAVPVGMEWRQADLEDGDGSPGAFRSYQSNLPVTDDAADGEDDEMTRVCEHLCKGEFHKVHYGLEQTYDAPNEPGEELLDASAMILTKSSESRLRSKAHELTLNPEYREAIFQTMIPEEQFLDAYKVATGVDLKAAGVWDRLTAKFGGMIPKETLLKYCRTIPVHGLESGIGGGVYSSFCSSEHVRARNSLNLFIFLVFVGFFVATLLPGRGLNVGYYQVLGIEEFLTQELGGSEEPNQPSTWFPWTFDDVAEPNEWWEFVSNVLDFAHFGQVRPGVYRNVGLPNNIIGGFKLHQWRVGPQRCSGIDGLLSNNVDQVCDWGATPVRSGLSQRYPDGTKRGSPAYADCEAGTCEYYFIPRNETKYIGNLARDRPICLKRESEFQASFNRTVRVAVFAWMSARIMVEIFKWLAEEQLGVRVEMVESSPVAALRSLQRSRGTDGIDIIVEAWDKLRETDIAKATDPVTGHAVSAGDLGLSGRTGLYANPSAIEACPGCVRVQAFRNPINARKFTCNCGQSAAPNQGRCATYACEYQCSRCTLSQSEADWCSDCGQSERDPLNLSAACDAAAGCDSRLGAIWDVHPSKDLANYGPELFRSKELRLASGMQLVFTRDADEMIDRVETASGIKGDGLGVGPIVWFWWEPHPLVPTVKARSVQLPTYSEENCPTPDPTVDDPNMTTEYDCATPTQFLLKLARRDIPRDYPDVFKLLLSLEFEAADLNDLMYQKSLDESLAYDNVACSWLRKEENSMKWRHWLPQKPLRQRMVEFHKDCYPAWPGDAWNQGRGNDERSYTEHSGQLGYMLHTNVVNGTRVIKGTGVSMQLPKDPEYFVNLTREARDNRNLSALRDWYRMHPWVYQDCTLPAYGLIAGLVLPSTMSKASMYDCDGYVAFFPLSWTRFRSQQAIEELKENNWVDIATRAVMMEMFVYCQNSGLIVRVRFLVEISATGGWVRSKQFTVFGLWQSTYDSWLSLAVRFLPTMMTTLYFLYWAVRHLLHSCRETSRSRLFDASGGHNKCLPTITIRDSKRTEIYCYPLANAAAMLSTAFLTRTGDVLDILVYIMVWIAWMFRFDIIRLGMTDVNILCTSQYPNALSSVADLWQHLDQIDALCAVLVFFRLLYFLRLVSSMEEILETVGRAAPNIFWLLVAFVIMMSGCTLAAWLVFGNLMFGYSGFTRSFTALLFVILGEHDFQELDAHRPAFAFAFFFFFFIVIICILFNLIIAVVGNAYNDVVSERVDVRGFVARVLHDPDTCAWAPLDMGRVYENPGVREALHLADRTRFCCVLCRRSPDDNNADHIRSLRRALMRNPRVFWLEYERVMYDLAYGDITTVLRAHAKVRLLMESAHVRQDVRECPYEHGDHVYVRDDPPDHWRKGVVEHIRGSEPLVRPAGWRKAHAWKDVTADRATFRKAEGASVDVRLLCDLEVAGERIEAAEYTTGRVLEAARIPAGTPPWRQAIIGKVCFSPSDPEGKECTVIAPRIAVEPLSRKVEREREEPHGRADVELLRVSDFLDSEFGKAQRPVIDLFLTQLPAKVLGVNRAGQWVQLLHHYSRWKRVASTYTKFGRTGDDLLGELHQRMLDEMQQQQLMEKEGAKGHGELHADASASFCNASASFCNASASFRDMPELKRIRSRPAEALGAHSQPDGDAAAREAPRPAAAPGCPAGTSAASRDEPDGQRADGAASENGQRAGAAGAPDEQGAGGGAASRNGRRAGGASAAPPRAASAALLGVPRGPAAAGPGAAQRSGSTASAASAPTWTLQPLPRPPPRPPTPLQSTAEFVQLQPHAHPLLAPTGSLRPAGSSPMRSPEAGLGVTTPLLAPAASPPANRCSPARPARARSARGPAPRGE
eukprot:TRINITY_DN10311_c0_g2_i3.p1 TRINITY_DN10311_c0_g2~~TRINITY_DN10311_c0_g2_i3.p1  ORF type:complete len:2402 (+),score=347.09 TRINITY_DN10311_c0_g2_i3:97-7206(+)